MPKSAPVSVYATRNSLVFQLQEYDDVMNAKTPNGESLQGIETIVPAAEIENPVPGSFPQTVTPESKLRVLQSLALENLSILMGQVDIAEHETNAKGRIFSWIGLILTGLTLLGLRRGIRGLFKRITKRIFSISPFVWLCTTLIGYFLYKDVAKLMAIKTISKALRRIVQKVEELKSVPEKDRRILSSWKWDAVPWKKVKYQEDEFAFTEHEIVNLKPGPSAEPKPAVPLPDRWSSPEPEAYLPRPRVQELVH